ncbi:MAG: hypothetical protein ACI9ZX_001973 [Algoriphagus sp.]|jgi:hypothetical protein
MLSISGGVRVFSLAATQRKRQFEMVFLMLTARLFPLLPDSRECTSFDFRSSQVYIILFHDLNESRIVHPKFAY